MKKKLSKKQAVQEIKRIFQLAKDSDKADDFVRKARRLAMKYKLKLPKALKRRFCKHCYGYLKPGINCRVRTNEGKIVYYCLKCKKYMRFPLLKKRVA